MISSAVSNNTTSRYTKINASQASLWGEVQPASPSHQLIEVHYHGGREEIYCIESSYRPTGGGFEIYAGYVGFPVSAEECTLCNKEASR